jgi:hypothetical protein
LTGPNFFLPPFPGFEKMKPKNQKEKLVSDERCIHGLIKGQCGICQRLNARRNSGKKRTAKDKKREAKRGNQSSN